MYYLSAFWVLLALFIVVYGFARVLKAEKVLNAIDENGMLFFMGLGSLAIVAIASKDPVSIAGIQVPAEAQWMTSLLVSGFGAWRYYLNPLKNKVYELDREVGGVKASISRIEKNVDKLLDRAMKK